MRFFVIDEQTTPDELRRQYRDLCKKHHPDKGGSDDLQAQINDEYKSALEQLSEMAARNGDHDATRELLRLLELHLRKMYSELKSPIIRRYIPPQYQGLAFEVAKIIEERI